MMMMMMMMMSCVMKWWVRQRLCWRCIRRRDSSSDQRWAHVESAQVGREAWECDQEARPLWDVWHAGTLKERQAPQTAESIEGLALQLRDFLCPVFRFGQTMQRCMHLWLSCLMWDKTSVSPDKPLYVKRLGNEFCRICCCKYDTALVRDVDWEFSEFLHLKCVKIREFL